MATGPENPLCERETIRQRMERRIQSSQEQIEKAQKMIAFLDAHPEFEEFQALKDEIY